jgi:phosphate acyltransferase
MSEPRRIKIVVDAMGGDSAPDVNFDGALEALEMDKNLALILVGPLEVLKEGLNKRGHAESDRLQLVHAAEVISMEDHGAAVIRKKRESSIHVGLKLVRDGQADAFISAGNSGAVMAGATFIVGRIENVDRPAIVVKLPTADGFITLLDAGANVDCRPHHLIQFAQMGSVFCQVIDGIERPRVALLSNGSETHKGNELIRETHELFQPLKHINYIGYIEGNDLFRGTSDVVVCDGLVGNIALKVTEGVAETAFRWFRREIRKDVLGLIGVALMKKTLKAFKGKFDYQPYGAAPLLGIEGMVLISHGGSTPIAIRNGIFTAKRGVEMKFVEKIRDQLAISSPLKKE